MSTTISRTPDTTPRFDGRAEVRFPFVNLPTSDIYARIRTRRMKQSAPPYIPAVATRTSLTNLLLRSTALDTGATWDAATGKVSVTANSAANPNDGQVTAAKILETADTSVHRLPQAVTISAGGTYTFAVAVVTAGRTKGRLLFGDATLASVCAGLEFDLTAGTVTAQQVAGTPTITNEAFVQLPGSEWAYLIFTVVLDGATTSAAVALQLSNGTTYSYAGDVTKGIYAYWPTLVLGDHQRIPLIDTTTTTRTVSSPDVDPDDPFAFLVTESEKPQMSGADELLWVREYATIPAEHVISGGGRFDRPVMHNIVDTGGTVYAASLDGGATSHKFTSRQACTLGTIASVVTSGAIAAFSPDVLTNNHVATLSDGTSTSNVNMSSTAAAIKNQLDTAFSPITCNVIKSGAECQITFSDDIAYAGPFDGGDPNTKEIEIIGNARLVVIRRRHTSAYDERTNNTPWITSVRTLTPAPTAGHKIVLWKGDRIIGITHTLTGGIPLRDAPAKDDEISHYALDSSGTRYVNGEKDCSMQRREHYYLPGFTTGITTADDIPNSTLRADPIGWLDAIVAGTSFPVISSNRSPWVGPIFVKATTEVQAADALETRNAAS